MHACMLCLSLSPRCILYCSLAGGALPSSAALPPPPASISSVPLMMSSVASAALPLAALSAGVPPTSLAGPSHAGGPTATPFPSLSTLLSTPLPLGPEAGSVVEKKCSPLIISPALSPIPAKVVDKVSSGAFVDFKEFLTDNVLLLQRLQDLGQVGSVLPSAQHFSNGSRLREVSDPLTWVACFLAFMATRVDHPETRELAAYGMLVLQLAQKHGGSGWLLYDRQFRQHKAAGAPLPWSDINASLMAATVLGQPNSNLGRTCSLCLAADHSREECALASIEGRKSPTYPRASRSVQANRQPRRFTPYRSPSAGLCYRYNAGACNSSPCRFEHACSNCFSAGHPEVSCPESRGRPRTRTEQRPGGLQQKPPGGLPVNKTRQ